MMFVYSMRLSNTIPNDKENETPLKSTSSSLSKSREREKRRRDKKYLKQNGDEKCHLLVLLVEFHLISPRWGLGGLKNLTVA